MTGVRQTTPHVAGAAVVLVFWAAALLAGPANATATAAPPAPPARPTIMHIVADDLGYNDLWDARNAFADNPHTTRPSWPAFSGGTACV